MGQETEKKPSNRITNETLKDCVQAAEFLTSQKMGVRTCETGQRVVVVLDEQEPDTVERRISDPMPVNKIPVWLQAYAKGFQHAHARYHGDEGGEDRDA